MTSGDKARIDLMERESRSILYLPKILGHLKGRVVIIRGGGSRSDVRSGNRRSLFLLPRTLPNDIMSLLCITFVVEENVKRFVY